MRKCLSLIIVIFITLISIILLKFIFDNKEPSNSSIKNTLEKFIETDFRYNGGDNNFSTLESKEFKEYLKARNDLKNYDNEIQNYKYFNDQFIFDYNKILKEGDKAVVEVFVKDKFSYYLNDERTDDASASDLYIIYLTKIDGLWKVSSATIKTDVDLIDNKFDVNKELNSDSKTFLKEKNKNTKKSENLNKMLESIKRIRENLNKNNN